MATEELPTRRALHAQLWAASSNLQPPPAQFEDDTVYRIKLKRAVTPPDHHFPLRPGSDVLVRGHVANAIREHIAGAVAVK